MSSKEIDTAKSEEIATEEIRGQMERILQAPDFVRSERLRDLFNYLIEEALAGRAGKLKGYSVAVNVFNRGDDFDPQTDSVVRIHAGRLRRALERYYFKQGAEDPLVITVPKGGYAPKFSRQEATASGIPLAPSVLDLPTGPAVVVVPFEELSSGEDQDYFAKGLAVEVNAELSKFQEIQVFGLQTGSFIQSQLGNRTVLARQVGARFLLEATVRRMEGTVTTAVTLTDTADGLQVWTESFDRGVGPAEILETQREIAGLVAARIGDQMGHIVRQLSKETRKQETEHPKSLEAILRFNRHQIEWTDEGHVKTMAALREAQEVDPNDALVLASLSEHLHDDVNFLIFTVENGREKAHQMAREAVHLEPRLQRTQFAQAYSYLMLREFDLYYEHAERALELNPNSAYIVGFLGWMTALAGDWEKGLALLEKGMALNPHYPSWFHHAPCVYHLERGELVEALSQARAFVMPGMPWDPLHRASINGHLGREAQARRALTELFVLDPEIGSHTRQFLRGYVFKEEQVDLIVEGLEKAGLEIED